jgi:oxygen-independent coproporphyrinogen-3 oxidase
VRSSGAASHLDPFEQPGDKALNSSIHSWRPRAGSVGAYLHIPFCTKRCGYCSFNTAPDSLGAVERFLPALLGEIDLVAGAPWAGSVDLRSVFLGGGTPSLLPAEAMADILERLRTRLGIEPGAEITVECNPESVSVERLAGYRRAGVTRISLGVQSLDDRILPTLDRLHSAAQARRAFDDARAAGFDDVSVDLIYGLPGLDLATWEETVKRALGWEPDHLSAYALTLDEGSLWNSAGVTRLPAEESVVAQYARVVELAAEAGFEHYEVSNYARPGHRSTHNQIYWRAEEYLGLGPGACGFLGDVRYGNVKPVERYGALVAAGRPPVATHETLTPRQRMAERLILGLRLGDGVPAAWLDERAALGPARLPATLEAWRERGLLGESDGRVRLTEAGFLLSDALFIELL